MTARTGADVKKKNVTRSDRNQIGRMMHATVNEVKQKKGEGDGKVRTCLSDHSNFVRGSPI